MYVQKCFSPVQTLLCISKLPGFEQNSDEKQDLKVMVFLWTSSIQIKPTQQFRILTTLKTGPKTLLYVHMEPKRSMLEIIRLRSLVSNSIYFILFDIKILVWF